MPLDSELRPAGQGHSSFLQQNNGSSVDIARVAEHGRGKQYEVSRLADRYADTALWPKIKAWATEKVRPLIPIPLRSLVDELP